MLAPLGLAPEAGLANFRDLGFRPLRYVVALGATVLVTGLLYYTGPNRPMKFSSVWPGAFLATTSVAAGDLRASRYTCAISPTTTYLRQHRRGDRVAGLDVSALRNRFVRLRI